MKTGLFVGILFIFGLIYCNSGQAPPTQNGTDLTTFLNEYFSARRTAPSMGRSRKSPPATTPSPADAPHSVDLPLSITIDVHEDTAVEYDDLVDSIFHKNFSFNDPNAVVPCTNGDMGPGECTPYYLCRDNGTIITDGSGKMIINFRLRVDEERECPILKPCCSLKVEQTKKEIKKKYHKKVPAACGLRNRNGLMFIAKNPPPNQAQEAEFSWTVAILERNDTQKSDEDSPFLCGGSLIHQSVVMTAAHCLIDKSVSSLFIRAGDWDSLSTDEFLPHQDRDIVEIVRHEHFTPSNGYYDIALLVLKTPLEITENVNTICLPPADYDFENQRCYASGWGTMSWKERHFRSIMKRIELPIVKSGECEERLRKTRLGIHFQLHESFVCAGGEKGIDTCRGDGGSPLVCPIPNTDDQYYQAGIVSWGIGCGDDVPAVYASITNLRPWIDEQMILRNLAISGYDPEASKKINYRFPITDSN